MKRAILGLGVAAVFSAAPVVAGTAAAAPPVRVTIVLSCDKGVDAQASVTLRAAVDSGDLATITNDELNCGPNSISGRTRARVVVDVPAGAVVVPQFAATAGTSSLDCSFPAGGPLPALFVCAPVGSSTAQLSVK
ncbi:MAG TPA: hypothetical protein VK549_13580 [Acidimicrobiia bacterium]|nr:hypothetical protein [Acidimicrobiia bacterium]